MPDGRVLVPDARGEWAQVIDVRDLAQWLLGAAGVGLTGVSNATGPSMPLADHLEVARSVTGHAGPHCRGCVRLASCPRRASLGESPVAPTVDGRP